MADSIKIVIEGDASSLKNAVNEATRDVRSLADAARQDANAAKQAAQQKKQAYELAARAAKEATGDAKTGAQAVANALKLEASAAASTAKSLDDVARAAGKQAADKAREVTRALREQKKAAEDAARAQKKYREELATTAQKYQQVGQSVPGGNIIGGAVGGRAGARRQWSDVSAANNMAMSGDGGPMDVGVLNQGAASADALNNSLTGLRNVGIATTVASYGIHRLGESWRQMGSDAVEAENLIDVSFKGGAAQVRQWSDDLQNRMGLDGLALRKMAGDYNLMFGAVGIGADDARKKAETLSERVVDIASLRNISDKDAFDHVSSFLQGETEAGRRIGVFTNEQTTKAYAYAHGIAAQNSELTDQQKILARIGQLMDQTAPAAGDRERTANSPENTRKRAETSQALAERALGAGSAEAAREIDTIKTSLLGIVGANQSIASSFGWISYMGSELGMGVGALTTFGASLAQLFLAYTTFKTGAAVASQAKAVAEAEDAAATTANAAAQGVAATATGANAVATGVATTAISLDAAATVAATGATLAEATAKDIEAVAEGANTAATNVNTGAKAANTVATAAAGAATGAAGAGAAGAGAAAAGGAGATAAGGAAAVAAGVAAPVALGATALAGAGVAYYGSNDAGTMSDENLKKKWGPLGKLWSWMSGGKWSNAETGDDGSGEMPLLPSKAASKASTPAAVPLSSTTSLPSPASSTGLAGALPNGAGDQMDENAIDAQIVQLKGQLRAAKDDKNKALANSIQVQIDTLNLQRQQSKHGEAEAKKAQKDAEREDKRAVHQGDVDARTDLSVEKARIANQREDEIADAEDELDKAKDSHDKARIKALTLRIGKIHAMEAYDQAMAAAAIETDDYKQKAMEEVARLNLEHDNRKAERAATKAADSAKGGGNAKSHDEAIRRGLSFRSGRGFSNFGQPVIGSPVRLGFTSGMGGQIPLPTLRRDGGGGYVPQDPAYFATQQGGQAPKARARVTQGRSSTLIQFEPIELPDTGMASMRGRKRS